MNLSCDRQLSSGGLWLAEMFPAYMTAPLGEHHAAFWNHVWSIQPGVRPPSWFSIWNRGGAKSTSAEAACVALAARKARRYGLYISGTQEQGDDHVGNVAGMLESKNVESFYPDLANPLRNKFGNSRGWRRNRIRTASGYTLDALGLDTAVRGVKLDEQRPDHIILDDIDALTDPPEMVEKKIAAITKGLLPAGSEDLMVLGIQNLIHKDGIFTQIVDGRAKFLRNRIVSGPIPALEDFEFIEERGRFVITKGKPTWAGFPLKRCEELLNDIGPVAFLTECQHEVHTADYTVVPFAWAEACRKLSFGLNPAKPIGLGVDVGAGGDETVITEVQGFKFQPQHRSRYDDPMRSVGDIVNVIRDCRNRVHAQPDGIRVRVNIDAIGVGWGVAGRVREVCEEKAWDDVEVNAVNVAETASDKEQWVNLRSELWWAAREACHARLWDLSALDTQCITELTTPTWADNSSGQIVVEKREKIVKRLGHSPDSASSLILAPYMPKRIPTGSSQIADVRLSGRR